MAPNNVFTIRARSPLAHPDGPFSLDGVNGYALPCACRSVRHVAVRGRRPPRTHAANRQARHDCFRDHNSTRHQQPIARFSGLLRRPMFCWPSLSLTGKLCFSPQLAGAPHNPSPATQTIKRPLRVCVLTGEETRRLAGKPIPGNALQHLAL